MITEEKLIVNELMRKELTRIFKKETDELNSGKLELGEPKEYPKSLDGLTLEQLQNIQKSLMESLARIGNIQNNIRAKICRLDKIILRKKAN